jgi:hypothetical protein
MKRGSGRGSGRDRRPKRDERTAERSRRRRESPEGSRDRGRNLDARGDRGGKPGGPGNRGRNLERPAAILLLAVFAAKTVYLALRIRTDIFPDEITHFGISQIFSHSLLPPSDSPQSYPFGLITHVPVLYYFLMGKLLPLDVVGLSHLIFLRLVNAALGLATVFIGWRVMRRLVANTGVRLLFLVLLTDTLMFTFLCAGVSYDNLANLLAAASLWCLLAYFQGERTPALLGFLACLCGGALTKTSSLLYAATLLAVLLVRRRSELGPLLRRLIASPFRGGAATIVLAWVTLALAVGVAGLYGGNLAGFGRLVPRADQVLTPEQAMENRIFARDYVVSAYRDGRISGPEALELASKIKHPGDRATALSRLRDIEQERLHPTPRLNRLAYAWRWIRLMAGRTYGVAGHLFFPRAGLSLLPYGLIFGLAAAILVWRFRPGQMDGMSPYLIFLVAGNALVLMQLVNYSTYEALGVVGAAIQGRYLFPVLIPFYALISYYLIGFLRPPWRAIAGGAAAAIFVLGGLPWFLERVTSDWFF